MERKMTKIKTLGISLAVATALSFSGCGSSSSNNVDKDEVTTKNYNGCRFKMGFEL
jgi:uncharacterized protein YceK